MSRADARRPALSARLLAVLAVLGLLVAGGLVTDVLVATPARSVPDLVAQPAATSGVWYCPVTAEEGESAVLSVAAIGDEPAQVTVAHYGGEGPVDDPPAVVSPGDQLDVEIPAGLAGLPVSVRWRGGPTVATWRVQGSGDDAAATCAVGPAAHWYVPGLDTADGTASLLHLFNPFDEDAVARVVFATPEGRVALVLTESVLVTAGRSVALDLSDFQPEQPDLGVVVEVRTGRLVVQGEVRYDPPGERSGTTGRGLLPAASGPALEWAFGYARADGQGDSWLSILNPGERESAVELRVSDPRPDGSMLLGEVSVPPGAVVRLDLAELSVAPEFGVGLTVVNDAPVVVARVSDLHLADGRRAVAAALGAPTDSSHWALAGAGTAGRSSVVNVYNPGPEPVEVEVAAGGQPLAEAAPLVVPPNARLAFNLAGIGERPAVSVRISANGGVVPELHVLSAGAPLRAWTLVAVPAETWTGPTARPPVLHDPALATRPVTPASESSLSDLPDGPQPAPPGDSLEGVTTTPPQAGPLIPRRRGR